MKRSIFLVFSLIFVLSGRTAFGQGDYLKTGQFGMQVITGASVEDNKTDYLLAAGLSLWGRFDLRGHYIIKAEGGDGYGFGGDLYVIKQGTLGNPFNIMVGITNNITKYEDYFNETRSQNTVTYHFGLFSNIRAAQTLTIQPYLTYNLKAQDEDLKTWGFGLASFFDMTDGGVFRLEAGITKPIKGPEESKTAFSILLGILINFGYPKPGP